MEGAREGRRVLGREGGRELGMKERVFSSDLLTDISGIVS